MNVLLVEDDPLTLELLQIWMKRHGLVADNAPDGSTALRLAARVHYDAVVTDHYLAGRTGLDTLRELRRIEGYGSVPVVIMTAACEDEVERLRHAAESLQPAAVLRKPFAGEELLATIYSMRENP